MKVLVTGISGKLGRLTALKLLQHGYEVVGIDQLEQVEQVAIGLGSKPQSVRSEPALEILNVSACKHDLCNRL